MNTRIFLYVGILLLIAASLFAAWQIASPTRVSNADAETFARANQLYGNGNYAAAENLYQQLIASGIENAEVYFNLGATYAAMGNANRASEMYARAQQLNPRDAQIAQVSSAPVMPFAQNEIALLVLALAGFGALLFVFISPRLLFKNQANV